MSDSPLVPLFCAIMLALVAAEVFGLTAGERVIAGVMACVALFAAWFASCWPKTPISLLAARRL